MDDSKYLLWLNLVSLGLNLRLIYLSYRRNKLVNLVYFFVFLFLVTGQSLNISVNLLDEKEVLYQSNHITRSGHFLASLFLFYFLCVFSAIEFFFKKTSKSAYNNSRKFEAVPKKKNEFSFLYVLVIFCIYFVVSGGVVALVGLNSIVDESRPDASGNTFFLTLLSLCIYPLLIKIITNRAIKLPETILFFLTFLTIMMFSRMTAIFQLMIVVIAGYYRNYRSYNTPLSKYKNYFLSIGFTLVVFFFGYGSWRHLKNYTSGLSFTELISYAREHPEQTLFSIDVNYKAGIEGISGLSGELSDFLKNPYFKMDGGISAFNGVINLIPSFIRGPLADMQDSIKAMYWYQGSVVGSGIEGSFVHFSFAGLLVYPFFLGWYANFLDKRLSQKGHGLLSNLILIILAVYGLLIIRGSTSALVFFIVVNLIMCHLAVINYLVFNNPDKQSKN